MTPIGAVLVLDDEQVVIDSVVKSLRLMEIRCWTARDIDTALTLLPEAPFELILTDLMLHGRSGFEFFDRMEAKYLSIPKVVMTGFATREGGVEALARGAFDFLPKPFDVEELLGITARAIEFCRADARSGVHLHWKTERTKKAPHEDFYFLGSHAWVRFEPGGKAVAGAAEGFAGFLGTIDRLEQPAVGEQIAQGELLCRIFTGETVHSIWSPLGGTIVEVNKSLAGSPDLLQTAPFFEGWLAKISPSEKEQDLRHLTVR